MEHRDITIKDIAQALGVSVSTVSRALQDCPAISNERRLRIQQYAREHHYHRNMMASSLRSHQQTRSHLIGVILPQFTHYYFSCILTAIEEECAAHGYRVLAAQTGDSYAKELQAIQAMREERVAGIIISQAKDTVDYNHFLQAQQDGIPLVFADRICTGVRTSRVVVDDYAGAYAATKYLIESGCRRIVFMGATMKLEISKNRHNGYRDALLRHGMQVDPELVYICDNREDAERLTPEILNSGMRPDGFMCINDDCAIGVMYTCKRSGLRIPEDVSVCGFAGGFRALSSDPQLTTVEQRGDLIGQEAARVMLDTIEEKIREGELENRIVRTHLVVRGSTR